MRGNREKTAVVLDRQPIWLEAITRLLDRMGVTVVGTTTLPKEALAMIDALQPTVLIADYGIVAGSDDGWATLRRAAASRPPVHTVVLSADDDPRQIEASFAAGASVYCVKTADAEDLVSAVRHGFQTSVYYAGVRAREAPASDSVDRVGLTNRELEILQLVAEGYSNGQLAKMLWVTEQTVKFHLSNIYRKLEVANRTEAARWAQVHGLLPAAAGSTATAAA